MKSTFLLPSSIIVTSIAVTFFTIFALIPEAFAQLPEENGNERPHLLFSAIGSFPMNDFGSQDPFLEDAGFAENGLGLGMGAYFYLNKKNTFIHLGAQYIGRRSTIWENTLPFIQEELGASSRGAVLNEIKYRHLPITLGIGQKVDLGQDGACMLIKGFIGAIYNGLSASSVRIGDEQVTAQFVSSGNLSVGFGGGICLLTNAGVGFEVEYLQGIDKVGFELVEERFGNTQTIRIPVSMLNVKLVIALLKP